MPRRVDALPLPRLASPLRLALYGVALAALTLAGGCAKTPAGLNARVNHQMLVQMTVRGRINPNHHYFFALDATGDTAQGPVPVIGPPWGNGWGAGRITHYVQIDSLQPGFYGFYRFEPGTNLLQTVYLGRPLAADPIQDTSVLNFTLDLDALAIAPAVLPAEINVNFIATDRIPLNPNDTSNKLVDALGVGGGNYVTINTQTNRIYRNADSSQPETAGDVADPDLDITDWQIEVRRP